MDKVFGKKHYLSPKLEIIDCDSNVDLMQSSADINGSGSGSGNSGSIWDDDSNETNQNGSNDSKKVNYDEDWDIWG